MKTRDFQVIILNESSSVDDWLRYMRARCDGWDKWDSVILGKTIIYLLFKENEDISI